MYSLGKIVLNDDYIEDQASSPAYDVAPPPPPPPSPVRKLSLSQSVELNDGRGGRG
jgi:hypothetical protein